MPNGESGILKALIDAGMGYIWFVVLAVWGGTVSYIGRIKKSGHAFNFIELIGEWTVAGFAGLMTAYICTEMGLSFPLTAALTGISGHMGGAAIAMMEKWLQTKLGWKSPSN